MSRVHITYSDCGDVLVPRVLSEGSGKRSTNYTQGEREREREGKREREQNA